MNTQPLVSVLIPLYNYARFLGATLDRVLRQTYANLEILISDNASVDNPREVLSSYNDSRITYIEQPSNIGSRLNIQYLLSKASGKYAIVLCADDLIDHEFIRASVEVLETDEGIGFVFARFRMVYEKSDVRIEFDPYDAKSSTDLVLKLVASNHIGPSGALVRMEALRGFVPYNARNAYLSDLHTWICVLRHWRAHELRDVYYDYLVHPDSDTSSISELRRYFELHRIRRETLMSWCRRGELELTEICGVGELIQQESAAFLWFLGQREYYLSLSALASIHARYLPRFSKSGWMSVDVGITVLLIRSAFDALFVTLCAVARAVLPTGHYAFLRAVWRRTLLRKGSC